MRATHGRVYRLAAAVAAVASLAACVSSTTIASNPPGARLYLNGQPVGVTPYTMADSRISGSVTSVHLELPGYAPVDAAIARNEELDVGALIGGILLLIPFLWILGYQPMHVFELRPPGGNPWGPPPGQYAPPPGQYQYAPPPAGYPGGYPPPQS